MVPPAATYSDSSDDFSDSSSVASFILPDPLTVQGVAKRRAAYGKLIAREAASADCEVYKGRTSHLHKPLAQRWDREWPTLDRIRSCDDLFAKRMC
jgi:aromatic amino acid aminotransferase I